MNDNILRGRDGKPILVDGKPIIATEKALAEMQQQRTAAIQHHCDELNKYLAIKNSALNATILGAIQQGGVPAVADQDDFLARCTALADKLSSKQLREKAEGLKMVLKECNVHEVPPPLVWGAKLAGVDLFGSAEGEPGVLESVSKIIT